MAKGLVSERQQKIHNDFMQYEKGYQQALSDICEWISEEYGTGKEGNIDYVVRRIEGAKKRERNN